MAHVIAEPCVGTKDTACVEVCPVDCIHEASDGSSPQLYIDPAECIDCAACVPACPVDAIFAEADLPSQWQKYTQINAEFYTSAAAAPAAAAAPSGAPAASAPAAAKKAPEPEPPPKPIELRPEDMYQPLSYLREELSEERGVRVFRERRRRGGALIVAVAAAVVLFVYAISNNFSKSVNETTYGRIAALAVGDGKPTLMGSTFTLTPRIAGKLYTVQVHDSIFGGRTLQLNAPSEPLVGIYHQDERFFVANTNQESRFYHIFIDENTDGRLDSVLLVREFWSKENRFIGRYQKPVQPTPELQAAYEQAAETVARGLGLLP